MPLATDQEAARIKADLSFVDVYSAEVALERLSDLASVEPGDVYPFLASGGRTRHLRMVTNASGEHLDASVIARYPTRVTAQHVPVRSR